MGCCGIVSVVSRDPDGNIWFTTATTIGRITTGAAPAKRTSR